MFGVGIAAVELTHAIVEVEEAGGALGVECGQDHRDRGAGDRVGW